MQDRIISDAQIESLDQLDVLSLIALREHYVRVEKSNHSMDDASLKRKWEAQDWIEVIDARLSNPQQGLLKNVPVNGSAAEHEMIPDQPTYDLDQFEKDYLIYQKTTWAKGTKDNAERVLKAFKKFIGNKNLCDFSAPDIEKFKAKRAEKVSSNTVNIDVRTLKAAFNIAVEWKKIKENPFRKVKQVKIPQNTKRFISDDEFIKLFDAIEDQWIKDLVSFDVLTGLRLGEVMDLKWADYDENTNTVMIQSSETYNVKGGKMRKVALPAEAVKLLANRNKKSAWIFTTDKRKKVSKEYASRLFKKAVVKAGLPNEIHFHSLRHTFGTKAAEANIPIHVIQKIMGHSSTKITEGYIGQNTEFMATEMQKMSIPKAEEKKESGEKESS